MINKSDSLMPNLSDSLPIGQVVSNKKNKELIEVTKDEPCRHCGKSDWCYRLDSVEVCKRGGVSEGWYETTKKDKEGTPYLASKATRKQPRPRQYRTWDYPDRDGNPLVRVKRSDDGKGNKRMSQESFQNGAWVGNLDGISREDIPPYRYFDLKNLGQYPSELKETCTVAIVEGESCADAVAAIRLGKTFATTNIGGSGKWEESDTDCIPLGVKVDIYPDMDAPGLAHALGVIKSLQAKGHTNIRLVVPYPELLQNLPKSGGKDIADAISEYHISSEKQFNSLVEAGKIKIMDVSPEVFAYLENCLRLEHNKTSDAVAKKRRVAELVRKYELVKELLGSRLKFNLLKNEVELDDNRMCMEGLRLFVALECNIEMSESDARNTVVSIAKSNAYHPVKDYLEIVTLMATPNPTLLGSIATTYFGTSDPLYDVYMKKQLIAAVARVFEPGCKVDTATILQGGQGIGKSSFWETLFSSVWFEDCMGDSSSKDELMKMKRVWGVEYAEFENVYRRKDVSSLKEFMATKVDNFRVPYGEKIEPVPRTSVLVGSTNNADFLNDPTGARRFWVIPVKTTINIKMLRADRDALWAAAVNAYLDGEQWHLSDEEQAKSNEENSIYEPGDTWEEPILEFIKNKDFVTVRECLGDSVLNIPLADQDKKKEDRVINILKKAGRVKCKKYRDGKQVRGWRKRLEDEQSYGVSEPESIGGEGVSSLQDTKTLLSLNKDKNKSENSLPTNSLTTPPNVAVQNKVEENTSLAVLASSEVLEPLPDKETAQDTITTPPQGFKVGDTVMYKRAAHKITTIDANGLCLVKVTKGFVPGQKREYPVQPSDVTRIA